MSDQRCYLKVEGIVKFSKGNPLSNPFPGRLPVIAKVFVSIPYLLTSSLWCFLLFLGSFNDSFGLYRLSGRSRQVVLRAKAIKLDCLRSNSAVLLCNSFTSYLTSGYLCFLLDNEISTFIVRVKWIDVSKAFRTVPSVLLTMITIIVIMWLPELLLRTLSQPCFENMPLCSCLLYYYLLIINEVLVNKISQYTFHFVNILQHTWDS